jgi:predicted XRE-type DNA-binding protein
MRHSSRSARAKRAPRVSALVKGVWRDFSADMLLLLAARVGLRPTLKLAA